MKRSIGLVLLAALLVPSMAFGAHTTYHGCAPCHTPHNAVGALDDEVDVPLWSGVKSANTFTLYDSPSFDATPDQPTGSSALCLSCHDGTSSHTWKGSRDRLDGSSGDWWFDTNDDGFGDTEPPADGSIPANAIPKDSNMGTDLRDMHPISIDYDDPALAGDTGFKAVGDVSAGFLRGKNGTVRVECASCHDIHDDTAENNLRGGYTYEDAYGGGALCQECHTY